MWLANLSPLGFLMQGFHVWMHEFGHATAAWMTGRRATPLPFGWTPVEPDYSAFVYFGLLLMFGILCFTGWKEGKTAPMVVGGVLAIVQYIATWQLSDHWQEFWWSAFGGVGGEFYLSALLMAAFYVPLPEKFKWGMCRYVFFLIGASAFLHIVMYWNSIYHGLEDLPMGSMINGEDDANGDMNKLMVDFGWTADDIRRNYQVLGHWCWAGLGFAYCISVLRLPVVYDWIAGKFVRGKNTDEG
jgi:hypothetical protein